MATRYEPLIDFSAKAEAPNVFLEPANIKATTAPWQDLIAIFNDSSTRDRLWMSFRVPSTYVSSPFILIDWTTTVTTNAWRAEFDYRVVSGTSSYNQAGIQQTASATLNAPAAAHNRTESTIALFAGNFSADAAVQCAFVRNNPNAADTMTAAAIVRKLYFQYSDT